MTKNKYKGSSETTREASGFNFSNFFDGLRKLKNYKGSLPNRAFLEWFIGFSEGNACFKYSHSSNKNQNKRPIFVINHSDHGVLYSIKKHFQFGTVKEIKSLDTTLFSYTVSKIEFVNLLILLFNGNLLMKNVDSRFILWVSAFNKECENRVTFQDLKQYVKHQIVREPDYFDFNLKGSVLDNAWLSGFADAMAGFYASYSTKLGKVKQLSFSYKRLILKFYIKQKNGYEILLYISKGFKPYLLECPLKTRGISTVKNKDNIFNLELTSKEDLSRVINYFDQYPLLTKTKWLSFLRWKRLYNREIPKDTHTKAFLRYERLVKSVGKIHRQEKE